MARKKQPRKSRLGKVILLLIAPFFVWLFAFLIWFYWNDLSRWFANEQIPRRQAPNARPAEKMERRERPTPEQPQEKILEEDRRKLEEILKRRN